MQDELDDNLRRKTGELPVKPRPVRKQTLPLVDIYCIGPTGFYCNLTRPGSTPFITSLHEIDCMIEAKQLSSSDKELTDEELVNRRLPTCYSNLKHAFSKAASDVLPPHRSYDHKIELESATESDLGYSPLYHQSASELQVIK